MDGCTKVYLEGKWWSATVGGEIDDDFLYNDKMLVDNGGGIKITCGW